MLRPLTICGVIWLTVCGVTPAEELSTDGADVSVITHPGADYADAKRLWQGIPSIERTRGGRLFVAWYSGGLGEGATENYCLAAVSDDGNRTYSPPLLVVQGKAGVRTGEPLPWLDPQGRLWLFWNEIHPDKARRGTWAIRCDEPDAKVAELKWTAPQFMGGGIVLGKPLVTRQGEWLAPLDVRNDSPLAAEIGRHRGGVVVSTDAGRTWTWRGGWQLTDETNDFDEHCIIECKDGSLFAVIRYSGGLLQSRSRDAGKTWSAPEPYLAGPRTRAFLGKLPSGRWLLVYHDGAPKQGSSGLTYRREALTAFLSDDEGTTWKKKSLLDARNRVSYPDATIGPEGQVVITYDYSRYSTGCKDVLTIAVSERDLLENRPLPTPTLVNRATGFGNVQELREGDEDKRRDEVNKKLLRGDKK